MRIVTKPGGDLSKETQSKKPTKKPRRKIKTLPALTKDADKWFSQSIRLRDSEFKGDGWYGTCITCSKTGQIAWFDGKKIRFNKGWDNGHFISRGHKIVRYDERNCSLQCAMRCNKMRSGEYQKYKAAIKLKFGDEVPEELERLAAENPVHKLTRDELNEVIKDSKEIIAYYTSRMV